MRNDECKILIILNSGWTQTFQKVDGQWTQTTNGVVRKCTAEQLLSHILPLLVEGQTRATIKVVKND
ncbi:MAG TPA: hypothetical protein VJ461_02880 [Candidatus Nanoarchaeia archaeon]|nr:hypothetical protein [Candidatus Nanoarchaeia archaeon]